MALPLGKAPTLPVVIWSCAYDIVIFGISLILRSSGLSIPQLIRQKRLRNAIGLLTAVSTVVRLEIALFLLPVVLSLVIQGRLSLKDAVLYGMISGLGALGQSPILRVISTDFPSRLSLYRSIFLATNPHPSLIPFRHLETTRLARTLRAHLQLLQRQSFRLGSHVEALLLYQLPTKVAGRDGRTAGYWWIDLAD
jgi:hypothetical protein